LRDYDAAVFYNVEAYAELFLALVKFGRRFVDRLLLFFESSEEAELCENE
jgi:hypothetical protein